MRKTNPERMTVVEQLMVVREDVCNYCCKYKERFSEIYTDPITCMAMLQGYCHTCPLNKIHYSGNEDIV